VSFNLFLLFTVKKIRKQNFFEMVLKLKAEGFQEFQTILNDIETKSNEIFILFSGSKDTTG